MDAKLQEVLLDYGLEGYGLYWYCLELVAGNVEPGNLNFELEHDCRIIARNTGSTPQRVQEMMSRFVDLGLFESSQGTITCLKMARVSDDYTAKLIRSERSSKSTQVIENKGVLQTPTKSEKVPLEEKRIEENRTDKNIAPNKSSLCGVVFYTKEGEWHCPDDYYQDCCDQYGKKNTDVEFSKAAFWLRSNPQRQKTKRGMKKFLGGWLQRNSSAMPSAPINQPLQEVYTSQAVENTPDQLRKAREEARRMMKEAGL